MDNVLGRDDNSNLKKALIQSKVTNIFDLLSAEYEIIDDLQYEDSITPGKLLTVANGDKMLIK
jgi:hypothetical protein